MDDDSVVTVPETPCALNDAQLSALQVVSHESSSNDPYAIDLYCRIVTEVERLLDIPS